MITISEHADGCVLPVRAQPGARKAGIMGEHACALKIAVTAPPADGKAKKAVLEILRELLHLKRSQVELLSGETSRDKRFLIRGLSKAELEVKLEVLLEQRMDRRPRGDSSQLAKD